MDQIISTIRGEVARFRSQTALTPARIFLGFDEARELIAAARPFVLPGAESKVTRTHFDGLPVFTVDAQNFIGIGCDLLPPCS